MLWSEGKSTCSFLLGKILCMFHFFLLHFLIFQPDSLDYICKICMEKPKIGDGGDVKVIPMIIGFMQKETWVIVLKDNAFFSNTYLISL